MTTNSPAVEDVIRMEASVMQGFLVAFLRTAVDARDDRTAEHAFQILHLTLKAAGALPVEPLPAVRESLITDVVAVLGFPREDELARSMLRARDTHALAGVLPALREAAGAAGYAAEARGFAAYLVATLRGRLQMCPSWTATQAGMDLTFEIESALTMQAWAQGHTTFNLPAEIYTAGSDWREPLALAPAHGWQVSSITDDPKRVARARRRIWWRAWGGHTVEYLAQEQVCGEWLAVDGILRRKVDVSTAEALSLTVTGWAEWLIAPLMKGKG